jgi:hypothetical protein
MTENYEIPEENPLTPMERVDIIDGFDSEESVLNESNENQENAEELFYNLIYGGDYAGDKKPNYQTIEERQARIEVIMSGMKKMIQEWHDLIKPKYIILNETSAIPFGYVFKEMWRIAYPDEEVPKFYRIDPRFLSDDMPSEEAELVYNFIKKRFDDTEANTIIFDEASISGNSLRRVKHGLTGYNEYLSSTLSSIANSLAEKDEEIKSIRKEEDELKKTFEILDEEIKSKRKDELEETFEILNNTPDLSRKITEARELHSILYRRKEAVMRRIMDKVKQDNPMLNMLKKEKIFLYGGFGSKGRDELQSDNEKNFKIMIENPREGIRPTKKEDRFGGGGLKGKIKRGAEGKVVLENIKKLKRLGMLLGQKIKDEIEQK